MKHRAVAITAREKAELVEVAAPGALMSGEVRGPTICSLISPGTELAYNYTGDKFPTFPGYSAVFRAQEVGSEVRGIAPGTILFCMGPHRSFQQAEAKDTLPVPEGLAPEKAVIARLMGVSMTTLMTTAARPGDRVMVTGAGPVGYLAAQMFRSSGYEVLIVEPDDERRRSVRAAGFTEVFEKVPCDDASIAGTVALAVECSGHEGAVLDSCKVARARGEVVLVGVPWRRRTELYAQEVLSLVFFRYIVLRSGWEWELPIHASEFRPHSNFSGFATALRWLAEGRIAVDGLITIVNPRDAQSAYQDLLRHKRGELFTVFDWGLSGA